MHEYVIRESNPFIIATWRTKPRSISLPLGPLQIRSQIWDPNDHGDIHQEYLGSPQFRLESKKLKGYTSNDGLSSANEIINILGIEQLLQKQK